MVWLGLGPKTTHGYGWKKICSYTLGIKPAICISVFKMTIATGNPGGSARLMKIVFWLVRLCGYEQCWKLSPSLIRNIWLCCHFHGWKCPDV